MALVTTIVIDLLNSTGVLTVKDGVNFVETVTYSVNSITFSSRPLISISVSDFLNLLNQINIFQTALIYNFSPVIQYLNSGSNCKEINDINLNTLDLTCTYGNTPDAVNYTGTKSTQLIKLQNRANPKTLTYQYWIDLLSYLIHYSKSIKLFMNV